MPRYILRIPVETLRDEDTVLFGYTDIPKHIDVKAKQLVERWCHAGPRHY
jgi:hypothetical protein